MCVYVCVYISNTLFIYTYIVSIYYDIDHML